jgi:NhaP-type Na+/H+ or K+/H+ antiporter
MSPKLTVFILLGVGASFISLLYYTFHSLLIFGLVYLILIPISYYTYKKQSKKITLEKTVEEHEDVL